MRVDVVDVDDGEGEGLLPRGAAVTAGADQGQEDKQSFLHCE